jgi:hypothetical protein
VAGQLQADRHIDHRPLVRYREEPAYAGRIVESVIAVTIDPGRDPTSAKSVKPEIWDQALTPTPVVLDQGNALIFQREFFRARSRTDSLIRQKFALLISKEDFHDFRVCRFQQLSASIGRFSRFSDKHAVTGLARKIPSARATKAPNGIEAFQIPLSKCRRSRHESTGSSIVTSRARPFQLPQRLPAHGRRGRHGCQRPPSSGP